MNIIMVEEAIMGKLVVDGNKVYTVDEACMRRKRLTLAQVREAESGRKEECERDCKEENRKS